ncbi:hypothetical protein FA95DRAFT_1667971 [Auriscalpium vulgare]|uniref:Uncharacterized protein n=1 Tax=Auriscalpium vulgare TaxID=40419 RepID=A0ACB8RT94_9AGAM|nr:hypothetical protein FA95DRAFT_1667971 [Auriscalpium vulgare]
MTVYLTPGQPLDWAQSGQRWLLRRTDSRSLYRQFNRLEGIDVRDAAHLNVHQWMDPSSPRYNAALASALFHYSARTSKDERFEACIATSAMKAATWRYAHESQIVLDGTFGVCDKKILLFIVMGIDENRKGLPLAFFLFSAPGGNRHTAAGYNTEVLTQLLTGWRNSLGTRDGVSFTACVAITDTDLMERGALVTVFPDIWLLICKFHLRQSWRNHRNKCIKGDTGAHQDIRSRLHLLEDMLVHSVVHESAIKAIADEREALQELQKVDTLAHQVADQGLQHLKYLHNYWTSNEALWKSWSDHGRHAAADLLRCPFEGVLPTTNHLESFNGLLKRKHLRRWQRAGRRLRLDILIQLLVFKVLPAIYEQRTMENDERLRWESRIHDAGGARLLNARSVDAMAVRATSIGYLIADDTRDRAAADILQNNQISVPELDANRRLTFTCFSSLALSVETSPVTYIVGLELDGTIDCTCADFLNRGGACKHLRAAILKADQLRTSGTLIPTISVPKSLEDAQALRSSRTRTLAPLRDAPVMLRDPIEQAANAIEDVLQETEGAYQLDSDIGHANPADVVGLTDAESEVETIPVDETDSMSESGCSSYFGFEPESEVEMEGEEKKVNTRVASQKTTPALPGDAEASINTQRVARALHELDEISPRLQYLTTLLASVRHIDNRTADIDIKRAASALSYVSSLAEQLGKLVTHPDHDETSTLTQETPEPLYRYKRAVRVPDDADEVAAVAEHWSGTPPPTAGPSRATGYGYAGLMPPSPEKASKRKKSYGVH